MDESDITFLCYVFFATTDSKKCADVGTSAARRRFPRQRAQNPIKLPADDGREVFAGCVELVLSSI